MRLIYGGHPTWFARSGRACIAIAPLVRNAVEPWAVYPPRRIDVDRLGVGAVVIPDGFLPQLDLPSVQRFAPGTPIYLGPLVDAGAAHRIAQCGYRVRRLAWAQPVRVGPIELQLLGGIGPHGALRQQVLVRSISARAAALIAGDSHAAPAYEPVLAAVADLRVVAVADEATLTPPRVFGTPLDDTERSAAAGAAARWQDTFRTVTRLLEQVRHSAPRVLVAGGSLMRRYPGRDPVPGCREQLLAEALATLAPRTAIRCVEVGDVEPVSPEPAAGTEPGIAGEPAEVEACRRRQRAFLAQPRAVRVAAQVSPATAVSDRLAGALAELALPLMMSAVGQAAVASRAAGLDGRRIGFVLLAAGKRHQWALDLNAARFVPLDGAAHASTACPYGLEMFAGDFLAVHERALAVDQLVGAGMRAWYPDHPANSLVQFMLHHYGRRPVGMLWS